MTHRPSTPVQESGPAPLETAPPGHGGPGEGEEGATGAGHVVPDPESPSQREFDGESFGHEPYSEAYR